jgi:hypothetical protein
MMLIVRINLRFKIFTIEKNLILWLVRSEHFHVELIAHESDMIKKLNSEFAYF